MGISGAFLTGDLFNLLVFFEVLLIASYGLLVHAADGERLRRATHYMILNLTGSSLFLVALGLLFGLVGTLNMADLARKVAATPAENVELVRAAALLLMVVFAIKGALLPLWFWLPRTYAAATPAVAALFAIMTKVGIYAVYRVHTLVFGAEAGAVADVAQPWLLPLGLATLALAALGALAAASLRTLVGYLVVASAGTLFTAFGVGGADALGAALYYLVHSTLAAAALFLLADLVRRHRPVAGDCLRTDDAIRRRDPLALAFIIAAVAIAALPPLSGFVAKVALLNAIAAHRSGGWLWTVVLVSGLLVIVAMARAGSHLFWRPAPRGHAAAAPVAAPAFVETAPLAALLTASLALSVLADPVLDYARAAAAQLTAPGLYVEAVLGQSPIRRLGGQP
jgi:multicomponent K+:H+ antiporter subunit D